MSKHQFFTDHRYFKSYRSVTRSYILKPNEKALINYIITWQEATDDKGKPLHQCCYESNATIARNLGIPSTTFDDLISKMKRKYDFFTSTSVPGKGQSINGNNLNRTFKRIDMVKLAAFLEQEEAQIKPEEKEEVLTPSADPEVREEAVNKPEEVPAVTLPTLKNRMSRDYAMNALSMVVEALDEDNDIFNCEPAQAIEQLRLAMMNHPRLKQEQVIVLNEWIEDFMTTDFLQIRELYNEALRA